MDYTLKIARPATAECSICSERKIRIKVVINPRPYKCFYIDEFERKWKGSLCPDCRSYDGSLEENKERYCSKKRGGCGGKLPPHRYFLCMRCEPHLPQDTLEYPDPPSRRDDQESEY